MNYPEPISLYSFLKTTSFIKFSMLKYTILICLLLEVAGISGKEDKKQADIASKKLSRQKRYSNGLLGEYLRYGSNPRNYDYGTMYGNNRGYEGDYGNRRRYGNDGNEADHNRYVNNEDYGRQFGNYDTSENRPVERPYDNTDPNSFRDYTESQWNHWNRLYGIDHSYYGSSDGNRRSDRYDEYNGRYGYPAYFESYNNPSGALWNSDRFNGYYRGPSGALWNTDRFSGNYRGEADLPAYDRRPYMGDFVGEQRPNNNENHAQPIKEDNTHNETKEVSDGIVDTGDRFTGIAGFQRDLGHSDNRYYGNGYGNWEHIGRASYDTITNERDREGSRDYDRGNRRYENWRNNERPSYDTFKSERDQESPKNDEENNRRNGKWENKERTSYDTATNERVREGPSDYDRSNGQYENYENNWPYRNI